MFFEEKKQMKYEMCFLSDVRFTKRKQNRYFDSQIKFFLSPHALY